MRASNREDMEGHEKECENMFNGKDGIEKTFVLFSSSESDTLMTRYIDAKKRKKFKFEKKIENSDTCITRYMDSKKKK